MDLTRYEAWELRAGDDECPSRQLIPCEIVNWLQSEVVKAIEAADAALGKLISGLKKRDLFDSIDIILVYGPPCHQLHCGALARIIDLFPQSLL
jgi:hypothetical protein